MKLKDSELKSILAEVEEEIASLLKSEGDAIRLAKGDGDEDEGSDPSADSAPTEGSETPSEEASEPAPGEGAPPVDAAPDASATDPSASPAPDASASPDGSPAPDASADPAADAGPVDPAALQAEYAKLPPEELKMHYMAAKAALFELMGAGAGPDASASPAPSPSPAPTASPSPAPAASPSPSPAPVPPPAMKAEVPATMKNNPANGGTESAAVPDAIKKSEEKVAELEKQVELMAKALEVAIGTPVRKAVTSVAHVPRTEEPAAPAQELSKSEVKDRIRKAVSSGKLSKSQKDLLFSYGLGNASFDQVKDLLGVK